LLLAKHQRHMHILVTDQSMNKKLTKVYSHQPLDLHMMSCRAGEALPMTPYRCLKWTKRVRSYNTYQVILEVQGILTFDVLNFGLTWTSTALPPNYLARNRSSENAWNVSSTAKALVAQRRSHKKRGKGRNSGPSAYNATAPGPPTRSCWNCGGPHHSNECPNPFNKALFDANKAKHEAARNARRPQGQGQRPRTKTSRDGKPLILNKQGNYILNKSKFKAQTLAAVEDELMSVFTQPTLRTDDPGMAPPASFMSVLSGATRTVVAPPSPPTDHVASRAAQTRAMVSATLCKLGKF
jgi:hypothetical protein